MKMEFMMPKKKKGTSLTHAAKEAKLSRQTIAKYVDDYYEELEKSKILKRTKAGRSYRYEVFSTELFFDFLEKNDITIPSREEE